MSDNKRTVRTERRRRRGFGQRGNAALEMALSLGPLFVIIFGTVDLAVWACWRMALNSALQDSVRQVITHVPKYNGVTYPSMTATVKAMMKDRSLGFINSSNVDARVRVQYFAPNDMVNPLQQSELPKAIPAGGGLPARMITNLNQAGNVVQIDVVSVPWNWIVAFNKVPGYEKTLTHASMNISLTSADVLPNLPVGVFVYPTP